MPSKDKRHLLHDIVASIDYIRSFADGITFDQYLADRKTRSAVERELLIISEAAVRLGPDAESICPALIGATFAASATSSVTTTMV